MKNDAQPIQSERREPEYIGDGNEVDRLTSPNNPNADGNAAWLARLEAKLRAI